ncbi:hypothetical protein P3T27_008179 [Kitasatospora sp. MAA19]|nr:hypothetical protein [Kitasatospora sp. MAA19]
MTSPLPMLGDRRADPAIAKAAAGALQGTES